jgi:ATP-dependent Clp protease ATP-binding subunit ClpB
MLLTEFPFFYGSFNLY